ncbi:redoxin domain-containing protein [Robertmurraya massiliosenegalensis]|uniref:redoxin domain-containing protein n=1 Tax=Robertmurraya TaxID=2837507 RepID=UPI0039A780FC
MVKRVAASLVFLILLSVGISHAINDEKIQTNGNATAIPVATNQGPKIGATAPDFTLSTLDGKDIQLSNLKGKKIMLNFWTTWCPPCKAEMPDMQKFFTEAGDEIEILAVNIDTSYDVAGFVEDFNITFPVLLDKDGKVMKEYRILTIPTTYFIDKNGVIQNKIIGAMTVEKMRELTNDL